jgi:hypothetical protein
MLKSILKKDGLMMNLFKRLVVIPAILFLILSCAVQNKFIPEEPQEGKCLLVGAVLIENDGLEDIYQAVTKNITVVISSNAEDAPAGYRVKTDENGYYILQNVPKGSYVVKGFEVDLGYETRLLVSSRWEGLSQIFYPTSGAIDFTVREWPEPSEGTVINMNIAHFVIDRAQRISNNVFKQLNNNRIILKDETYTMPDPVTYFRQKYPDWKWFSMDD